MNNYRTLALCVVYRGRFTLGMLASRFFIAGVAMYIALTNPVKYKLFIDGMIGIQVIDLLAGIIYVIGGTVEFADAIIPMFNATVFAMLLFLWRPKGTELNDNKK